MLPLSEQLSGGTAISSEMDYPKDPFLLQVKDVSKRFGPTIAVESAEFTVKPGEILTVMGENGSGKSTLVKILSGVHVPDTGTIMIRSETHDGFASPAEAIQAGVGTVFQEVLSVESMTVLENLWLGTDGLFKSRISKRTKVKQATEILEELFDEPPALDQSMEELSLSDRQGCAIARTVLRRPKLLILDEATSALDYGSRTRLFEAIERLRENGTGVIFITHRMDEVEEISDRITVLRSGRTVGTLSEQPWSMDEVVRLMTGSDSLIQETVRKEPRQNVKLSPAVLRATNLGLAENAEKVNFELRAGELVGLAGLEGQGQTKFLEALSGRGEASGNVEMINGSDMQVVSPHDAASRKIAYVPRERRAESIFPWMSILENFAMPTLSKDSKGGIISETSTRRRLEDYGARLRIKYGRDSDGILTLSGGNQQKVVIARWLATEPQVLLLNDPTRGIDINAKRDLYALLRELTLDGLAVVMLSSEVDEHLELMDRVLVFHENNVVAEHHKADMTRDGLVSSFFATGAVK